MRVANAKMTFWGIEPYKGTHKVSLSEGSKNRDGSWESTNWWSYVIGPVAEKFYALPEKSKIIITEGYINKKYDKNTRKENYFFQIKDFIVAGDTTFGTSSVVDDDDDELPFK